jgi:hypothetical protein
MTLKICMCIVEGMAESGVKLSEYGIWEVSQFINYNRYKFQQITG